MNMNHPQEGYNGYLYDINDIQRASKRILEFTEMSNNKYKKICVNSFNYANNFLTNIFLFFRRLVIIYFFLYFFFVPR